MVDSSEFVPLVVLVLGSNEESRLWNECHASACKILRKDGSEYPSAAIAAANGQIAEALASRAPHGSDRIAPPGGSIRIRSDGIRTIRGYPRFTGPGPTGAYER